MPDYQKYHALGNVYLVIDPRHTPSLVLTERALRLICDWHYGVGSDGILYGPLFSNGLIRLRIFNPDGSEAEKSGNGLRIFARYLRDYGYVTDKGFSLQTPGGAVEVEVLDDPARQIKVDMGAVTFWSERIPVAGAPREVVNETLDVNGERLLVTCASIGNPHCVVPLPEVSKEMALRLGPQIENHPLFPKRINVQFMKVLDRHNLQIEIWERGAGYTLASGSSSCAAASAAQRLGLVDSPVQVHMPGGALDIELRPEGRVQMTGPAARIASGDFSEELWKELQQPS
jgi:diaminopimelate epimerase